MLRRASSLFFFVLVVVTTLFLGVQSLVGCGGDDAAAPPADAGLDLAETAPPPPPPDTRPAFNLRSAQAISARKIQVTFAEAPNPAQAAVLSNYNVPGLTLSGTPDVLGNVVTLATSRQAAQKYTVAVSNAVTRQSDAKPLVANSTVDFTGRAPFDVVSAESTNSITTTLTFSAPPDPTAAGNLANYSIGGLTLSGTPVIAGNTVALTTSTQTVAPYLVTVTNVTRAADQEPLDVNTTSFDGTNTFNVVSAQSASHTSVRINFDGPPNIAQAIDPANYTIPDLALTGGNGAVSGNSVTFSTDPQLPQTYTVTVANVTRATDAQLLTKNTKTFTGRTSFNVVSVVSTRTNQIKVTFDAAPSPQMAVTMASRFTIPGLTVLSTPAPTYSGNSITLATTNQDAQQYDVTVGLVVRAADAEQLANDTASFTGRTPFTITGATSLDNVTMNVTFSDTPASGSATTIGNYVLSPALAVSGTPALAANTVTVRTDYQEAKSYTVTVSNVTRASDGEPLTQDQATFTGTPMQTPTVANVIVQSTNPDNGTIPYNTGTVTVTIVGTDFASSFCPNAVHVADLDGIGGVVKTQATSCTVDSNSQITATFPAGIRTNGTTGWDVLVQNNVGTNGSSAVKLVPVAGLLVSEVMVGTGTSGSPAKNEFVEIYNPTATAIDIAAIGLHLWIRDSAGDTEDKPLTKVGGSAIASHGFLLFSSAEYASTLTNEDYTYAPGAGKYLGPDGGVYISLSGAVMTSYYLKVIDKVGWGAQPVGGYEGTAASNPAAGQSIERKPAGGAGHATDTDDNSADWNAPGTPTPRGTVDTAQP